MLQSTFGESARDEQRTRIHMDILVSVRMDRTRAVSVIRSLKHGWRGVDILLNVIILLSVIILLNVNTDLGVMEDERGTHTGTHIGSEI